MIWMRRNRKPWRRPRNAGKGKKEQDMSGLPTNQIDHYMTEEELTAEFGKNGWKQFPDAITRRYRFIPAKVEVDEQNIILACMPADQTDIW